MAVSVLEKVLGNHKFYTETYIKDTITLVKSITLKNDKEAQLYNDLLRRLNPAHPISEDRTQWQYYWHITGKRTDYDRKVMMLSLDDGKEIELTRKSLQTHRRTHQTLLAFGMQYDALIKQYPEMELYIKAIITTPQFHSIQEAVDAKDFTIASYDPAWIEENESDVIAQLQLRIDNYKSIWLIGYYAMADNLFLASQYHILYNFLVCSLLAIRLSHAKTMQAHSYHIRLYLASHHYLDDVIMFLTRKQMLFLYRNLRYLDNHSGSNFTFRTLIDVLFSERNISVVNYAYHQKNSVNSQGLTNYRYRQRLLNNKPLIYSPADYPLASLAAKERFLAPGNADWYDYGTEQEDFKHRCSLVSHTLSKDLETLLLEETDSVRFKLLPTLTDYWAQLLKDKRLSFLAEVTDPVTSSSHRLNIRDLFKLYLVVLYTKHGVELETFPTYRINRVFKEPMPSSDELLKGCYDLDVQQRTYVQTVLDAIPNYRHCLTSYQFGQWVTEVYRLNISLWNMLSNLSDMDTEGQMAWVVEKTVTSNDFEVDLVETVDEFFTRTGISDARKLDPVALERYLFDILDTAYDKQLSFLSRNRKLQEALTKVFFKFNSYTVQLINNYYGDSPLLVGPKDTRFAHSTTVQYDMTLSGEATIGFDLITDVLSRGSQDHYVDFGSDYDYTTRTRSDISLGAVVGVDVRHSYQTNIDFFLNNQLVSESDTLVSERLEMELLRDATFGDRVEVLSQTHLRLNPCVDLGILSHRHEVMRNHVPISCGVFDVEITSLPAQSSDDDLLFLALYGH